MVESLMFNNLRVFIFNSFQFNGLEELALLNQPNSPLCSGII